jgi:hypothetical protein
MGDVKRAKARLRAGLSAELKAAPKPVLKAAKKKKSTPLLPRNAVARQLDGT